MDIVKPILPVHGFAVTDGSRLPPENAPASTPRPDVPPVRHVDGMAPTAPRPFDNRNLGLVQAGLLSNPAPLGDYSPERALKPWGIAMLPDAERAEARRDEMRQQAETPPAEPADAQDPGGSEEARPDRAAPEESAERTAPEAPPSDDPEPKPD